MTASTEARQPGPRLKLVVTEGITGEQVERLAEYAEVVHSDHAPKVLRENARDADAMLVRTLTQVDRELLDCCPRLRAVARYGVGLDNFDLEACAERGVEVYNAPGQNAIAVAEMTMLMILMLARAKSFDPELFDSWERDEATGVELHSQTLGIIGLGAIGQQVASRAQAFGMRVIANDPYIPDYAWGSVTSVSVDELLAGSDIVSLHVPATHETRGMVDAAFLGKMKRGAWFLNTARGSLMDEDALVEALNSGQVGKAALDVRAVEPTPRPDPFRDRDDVLMSPHVAGFTEVSLKRLLDHVCDRLAEKLQTLQVEGARGRVG